MKLVGKPDLACVNLAFLRNVFNVSSLKSICLHAAQNAFDYGHIFAVGHTPELTSHQTQPCRIGNEKEAVHLIGPLRLRLQSDDRAERSARTGPIHGLNSAGSYLMCSDKDVSVCLWGRGSFLF